MNNYSTIQTGQNLVVVFNEALSLGLGRTVSVNKDNPIYKNLLKALEIGDLDRIKNSLSLANALSNYSDGRFEMVGEDIYVRDQKAPQVISQTIMRFMEQSLDFMPLVKFWDNLSQNPVAESREELYGYLATNHFAITEDGCFLAYKKVCGDFKDIYSKTFDNSPGQILKMDRHLVDHDRRRTCSNGFHVCSWNYLSIFGTGPGNRVVLVKVNPMDAISVPSDNEAKLRVCEYEVLSEYLGSEPIPDSYVNLNGVDYDDDSVDEDEVELSVTETRSVNVDRSGRVHIPKDFVTCNQVYDVVEHDSGFKLERDPDGDLKANGLSLRIPKSVVNQHFGNNIVQVDVTLYEDDSLLIS